MRKLNADFKAHIESGQTTLANCWKIIRVDGVVLGFTDHDKSLTFDGVVFSPSYGMDASEIASKLGAQTDTSEIIGIVNSDAIDENDVLLGRFDNAKVESYKVNWRDVNIRQLIRQDSVGEIVRTDGVFRLELRSAQHAMNVNQGRIYQSLCDCALGDDACKIDIEQAIYKHDAEVISLEGRQGIVVALLSGFASDWFNFGFGKWTSGKRIGLSDKIILQQEMNGQSVISFEKTIDEWTEIGDTVTLYAGCDRRLASCTDKFSNVMNFRGFPHVPGSDFVLRYPNAGTNLDGRALFS